MHVRTHSSSHSGTPSHKHSSSPSRASIRYRWHTTRVVTRDTLAPATTPPAAPRAAAAVAALAVWLLGVAAAPIAAQDPPPVAPVAPVAPPAASAAAAPGKTEHAEKTDPLAVTVPIWPNSTCAIMGKPVSTRLFVDIEYGRMYVCCKSCNRKIRRDPHRTYKTAYPTTKVVGNVVCPVSGERVPEQDPPIVLLQGHEIALARPDLAAQARAHAQVVLAKVNTPGVVDVANRACPITGEEVQPNAYCLIGDHLVHLSSPACVKQVENDPAKALAAAQDKTRQPLPAKAKPAVPSDDDDEDGDDEGMGMEGEPRGKAGGHDAGRRGSGRDTGAGK